MENTAFVATNCDLINNPKYQKLDATAMMLYSLYEERVSCSQYNVMNGNQYYKDEQGRIFIIFTNEQAAAILHTSAKTIANRRKQLEDCHLVTLKRNGLKGWRIYVNPVESTPANIELIMSWKNYSNEANNSVTATESQHNRTTQNVEYGLEETGSTNWKKGRISISHSSISHPEKNMNECMKEHAHVRACDTQTREQSNSELPVQVRAAYLDSFGYISNNTKKALLAMISQTDAEMVAFAIQCASEHNAVNPIAYLQSIITSTANDPAINNVEQMMAKYAQNKARNNAKFKQRNVAKQPRQRKQRQYNNYRSQRANINEELPEWAKHPENIKDKKPTAEQQAKLQEMLEGNRLYGELRKAVQLRRKLYDADIAAIKKNLSQPNGYGHMAIDAPKLWEQYCQQQGENVLV